MVRVERAPTYSRSRQFRLRWAGLVFVFATVLLIGCATRSPFMIRPGPVVMTTGSQPSVEALRKVAVMLFYPAAPPFDPTGRKPDDRKTQMDMEDAASIGRLVSEALVSRNVATVTPHDFQLALNADGLTAMEPEPHAAAEVAARVFGATSVLLGRVIRYRGRNEAAAGGNRASSVVFEVSVYEVSSNRVIWSGRFAETQQAITRNIFRAREYPGRGTRWLSAAELAHWGADQVVEAMLPTPLL